MIFNPEKHGFGHIIFAFVCNIGRYIMKQIFQWCQMPRDRPNQKEP